MNVKYSSRLPWNKINDFLLEAGSIRDPRDFTVKAAESIFSLVPYDQARIFFINTNGRVHDVVLIGDRHGWIDAYLEYYSKIEDGKYSISKLVKSGDRSLQNINLRIRDWTQQGNDEFMKDYIKPQGIHYSASFMYHSTDNFTKSIYVLDRISRVGFSKDEVDLMNIVQPHLDNLYRNMHVMLSSGNLKNLSELEGILSKREREISKLICNGLTPAQISERLFICVSTIYRHLANIHLKLNVSTRQELILKLIKFGISPEI